ALIFSHFLYTSTSPRQLYTLSLHDALPILFPNPATEDIFIELDHFPAENVVVTVHTIIGNELQVEKEVVEDNLFFHLQFISNNRSEEHTSELQSRENLVCRLLLEKKKKNKT